DDVLLRRRRGGKRTRQANHRAVWMGAGGHGDSQSRAGHRAALSALVHSRVSRKSLGPRVQGVEALISQWSMPRTRDIIVIGAGVIGCAIAYELARRGASIDLLDERSAGAGATKASAGMLAPYIEAEPGSELFALTVRSLDLFDSFIERVRSES